MMMMQAKATRLPILALALAGLAACMDASPVEVDTPHAVVAASEAEARAIPDVSGEWNWEKTEFLRFPRWVVEQVINPLPGPDLEPEGPNTFAECASGGTMILSQSGASFEGVLSRHFGGCVTRGGQAFQGPAAGLPVSLFDGWIHGGSLAFSTGNLAVNPCPTHAVITEFDGDVATAFSGSGRCVIPGHPQSEAVIQLDPPPGGTSVTTSFEAWRD